MKYHPDKNDNDLFFEDRFREVQEAYDTLIDENRRTMYDRMRGHQLQAKNSSLPPSIEFFSVTKIRAMKGEEISVTWKTHHADVVKIQPFGLVPPYGEKNIKITEFKNQKFHLVLQANNSFINKTVVKGITIQEIFQVNLEKQNPEPINKAKMDRVEKDTFSKAIRFIIASAEIPRK